MSLLDDDFPDYFVNDDTDDHSADPAAEESASRHVINFVAPPTPAEEDEDDRDDYSSFRFGRFCFVATLVVAVAAAAFGYFRYYSPYIDDAVVEANIVGLEHRGTFFKTYEADLRIAGTDSIVHATIRHQPLARRLQNSMQQPAPLRLRYARYHAALPWHGESTIVVTAIIP